jgi:hypothetical protein
MSRINRIQRARLPKASSLLPPPPTAALCRIAVQAATIEKLCQSREQLKNLPGETIASGHLGFEIAEELTRRFRDQLGAGLTGIEAAKWIEILGDRKFVEQLVARKAKREAEARSSEHLVIPFRGNHAEN